MILPDVSSADLDVSTLAGGEPEQLALRGNDVEAVDQIVPSTRCDSQEVLSIPESETESIAHEGADLLTIEKVLECEQLIVNGDIEKANAMANRMLETPLKPGHEFFYASALSARSFARQHLNDQLGSIEDSTKSLAILESANLEGISEEDIDSRKVLILVRQADAMARSMNVTEARNSLESAQQILLNGKATPFVHFAFWNNTAAVLESISDYDGSVDASAQAISAADRLDPEEPKTTQRRALARTTFIECSLMRSYRQLLNFSEEGDEAGYAKAAKEALAVGETVPEFADELEASGFVHFVSHIYDTLGAILAHLGRYEEAAESLELFNKVTTDDDNLREAPSLMLTRAQIARSRGSYEEALEELSSVEGLAMQDHVMLIGQAFKERSLIHEEMGDHKAALDAYKKFHRAYAEQSRQMSDAKVQTIEISMKLAEAKALAAKLLEESEASAAEARMDPLTGIGNRRRLEMLIPGLCNDGSRSLMMVDLDHFKSVNDTYGHAVGDAVLALLGETLRTVARSESDVPIRLGGEEFAFLVDAHGAGAAGMAERVRAAIESADWGSINSELRVTASIGVATFTGDFDETMCRADAALYKAKESGRNRVVMAD